MLPKMSWFAMALAGFLALTGGLASAQTPAPAAPSAPAASANVGPRLEGNDMVMGAANAPVTIIEYASLTCPHCAAFSTGTFPRLKEQYIDTGLVRFIFRDFPLDNFAFAAAVVARCAGPERFFGFIEVFFQQQDAWTRGNEQTIRNNMRQIARLGGMSDE